MNGRLRSLSDEILQIFQQYLDEFSEQPQNPQESLKCHEVREDFWKPAEKADEVVLPFHVIFLSKIMVTKENLGH